MMFWIKHQTGSASLMGVLMMLIHLPIVVLGPVAGTLADHYFRRRIIILCDLLAGIAVLALAVWAAIGAANGFVNTNVITLLQTSIASELRGRIFGLLMTLTTGLTPIGLGLGGVIGDMTGRNIPLIYGTCGAVLIILSVVTALLRPFRRFLTDGTLG